MFDSYFLKGILVKTIGSNIKSFKKGDEKNITKACNKTISKIQATNIEPNPKVENFGNSQRF